MQAKRRTSLVMLLICPLLTLAGSARAAETVALQASFSPDRLGASTNLSATATFGSTTTGPQPPIVGVSTYGPAGMRVDVRGAGVCTASPARLEASGPGVCPADSRLGFGRAEGLQELAGELIPAPFTLEFFLAPSAAGQLTMLVYVSGVTPASVQFVLVAKEVHGPSPYGVGISFAVPLVPTIPGAALGWVEHVLVTLGSANVAYYRTVHGKRTLSHVIGVTVPKRCPAGGFPLAADFRFHDGTATDATTRIPCPHR